MNYHARRNRWGDNDRNFGPFTYARDSQGYRPIAVVLGSGDDDENPGCRLRVSGFGHTVIASLPPVIQPWRRKVIALSWDAETVARMGRNWYYDAHKREYGFSYSEGFLQVFLGRQTHDSSTDQNWSAFLPWTQWNHVRHSFYGLEGEHFWTEPPKIKTKLKGEAFAEFRRAEWDAYHDAQARCPTRTFAFYDFDGDDLTAKTRIEEREWRFGTGWFRWLSLFRRPKIRRSLNIDFSGETGRRKGSWKGGTMGTGIDMLPGELHASAFQRYCAEHQMTFVAGAEPVPA